MLSSITINSARRSTAARASRGLIAGLMKARVTDITKVAAAVTFLAVADARARCAIVEIMGHGSAQSQQLMLWTASSPWRIGAKKSLPLR
jgi:hypothetical protein